MNDQSHIAKEAISEGLRGVFELIPLVYVIIVIMAVIGFGIVKFNGDTIKNYKIWVIVASLILGGVAYLFYPEEEVKVRDIPTLLIGCVASLFFIQLFIYWRKKKGKL